MGVSDAARDAVARIKKCLEDKAVDEAVSSSVIEKLEALLSLSPPSPSSPKKRKGELRLRVSQNVDCKDHVGTWIEATVKDLRNHEGADQCYVHYQGWNARFDEWVSISSGRLAMRGTFVKRSKR